jgi:hypothetical protein
MKRNEREKVLDYHGEEEKRRENGVGENVPEAKP